MIINGSSNRCVWWWAQHLESEDNDKVRIAQSYGLRSGNIYDMLCEMQAMASGTDCQNFFYQINMNPAPGERLTGKDWERAREIAEKKHGLEGQPYFMVMHTKYGREHPHFIYLRVNLETGKAISDSYDARKNHAIAREIERELGLQKVIGPYDREAERPRPARAPKRWEMYRDQQHGLDTRDITAEVTELRQQSRSGAEFKDALESRGYELVTGRRGLLILDTAGNEHSLARRSGMSMKELNAFMRDVDRQALPTVEQAKAQYQERKITALEADRATVKYEIEWEEKVAQAAIEKEKIEGRFIAPEDRKREARAGQRAKEWPMQPPQPEPVKTSARHHFDDAARETARQHPAPAMPEHITGRAAHIWSAYNARIWERENQDGTTERITLKGGRDPYQFGLALEDKGLALARVTKEEAERSRADADHWKKHNEWRPVYRESEFVVITPRGEVYQLNRHTTGHDAKEVQQFLGKADWKALKGIEATKEIMQARAEDRAAERHAIRDEITAARMERAANPGRPVFARTVKKGVKSTRESVHETAAIAKAPARAISALLDTGASAAGILFSLVDTPKSPRLQEQQNREGKQNTARQNAEAEVEINFSKYAAEHAQEQHNRQQEQAARDRQRERERDQ